MAKINNPSGNNRYRRKTFVAQTPDPSNAIKGVGDARGIFNAVGGMVDYALQQQETTARLQAQLDKDNQAKKDADVKAEEKKLLRADTMIAEKNDAWRANFFKTWVPNRLQEIANEPGPHDFTQIVASILSTFETAQTSTRGSLNLDTSKEAFDHNYDLLRGGDGNGVKNAVLTDVSNWIVGKSLDNAMRDMVASQTTTVDNITTARSDFSATAFSQVFAPRIEEIASLVGQLKGSGLPAADMAQIETTIKTAQSALLSEWSKMASTQQNPWMYYASIMGDNFKIKSLENPAHTVLLNPDVETLQWVGLIDGEKPTEDVIDRLKSLGEDEGTTISAGAGFRKTLEGLGFDATVVNAFVASELQAMKKRLAQVQRNPQTAALNAAISGNPDDTAALHAVSGNTYTEDEKQMATDFAVRINNTITFVKDAINGAVDLTKVVVTDMVSVASMGATESSAVLRPRWLSWLDEKTNSELSLMEDPTGQDYATVRAKQLHLMIQQYKKVSGGTVEWWMVDDIINKAVTSPMNSADATYAYEFIQSINPDSQWRVRLPADTLPKSNQQHVKVNEGSRFGYASGAKGLGGYFMRAIADQYDISAQDLRAMVELHEKAVEYGFTSDDVPTNIQQITHTYQKTLGTKGVGFSEQVNQLAQQAINGYAENVQGTVADDYTMQEIMFHMLTTSGPVNSPWNDLYARSETWGGGKFNYAVKQLGGYDYFMPDPNNDPDESIIADLLTQYASEAEVVLKAYIANNMADNPITKQPDVMMYEDKWFKHAKNSMQIVLLHFLDELRPVRTSESGTIHVGRGPFDKVPRAHVRRGAHFAMTMNLQHADFDNPENVALYDSKYKPAVKNGNLFGDEIVVFNTWSNDSVQRTGRLGEALIFDNKYSRSVLGTVNKSDLVGAITDGSGKLNLNNLSDMQKRALKKIATGDMSFDTNRDTGSKNINHRSVYTGLYENDVDKVIDGFLSTNESGLNALTSGWLRSPNSGGYNLVVRLPEGGATIPQYKRKDGSMAEINVDIAERHFNSPLDWVGSIAMEQLLGRRLTAEETSGLLTFLGAN